MGVLHSGCPPLSERAGLEAGQMAVTIVTR